MSRALVTGATGMLGSYIVERLQDRGWEVRALVRDPERATWLQGRGVELAVGDLGDRASLEAESGDGVVVEVGVRDDGADGLE